MSGLVGLRRVVRPAGVLPQAAWRLDARPEIAADEVRIGVERLNLDAASFRQLSEKAGWDGRSEQVPARGHAILFGRSVAAVLPDDLPAGLALAVFDVCGAPALTDRVVRGYGVGATVAVLGGAGKSGSLALAAARAAG